MRDFINPLFNTSDTDDELLSLLPGGDVMRP